MLSQVAQALLVLLDTEVEIAGLEGLVAKLLDFRSDAEDLGAGESVGSLVIGEIFVLVAGNIVLSGAGRLVTSKLTTVCPNELAGCLPVVPKTLTLNSDGLVGLIGGIGLGLLNLANDTLARNHLSEDDVLVVKVGGFDGGDEELRAIGAGAGVGHGEEEGLVVLLLKVLVIKAAAID